MEIKTSKFKMNDNNKLEFNEKDGIEFKTVYSRFKELFKVKKDFDLIKVLRSKNSTNQNACTMSLPNGTPAWICETCRKDEYSVICMKCFDQGNHKDHKVTLRLSVDGCCDCGDPEALKESGFCSEHKGIMCSNEEIEIYINKTFNNDYRLISEIKSIFDEFFHSLANIIEELEKNLYSKNQLNFNNSSWLINNLTEALDNLDIICEANSALRLIAVDFFEKNYSFKTKHICLQFIERDNQVIIEKINYNEEIHPCKCSFLQNLLRIWDKSLETKYDIQNFFFNFLKSYKFKFLYGYCYISLYDILLINDSQQIKNFSFQIMLNEEISIKLISSSDFVNYLFYKLFYLVNDFTSNRTNELKILDDIITEFFLDMCYMLKPKSAEIFAKNINYYLWFIDILPMIQYANRVKFSKTFQYEAYNENLIMVEYYLLNLFSLIITIIDIDKNDTLQEIIIYLLEKIYICLNNKEKDVFSFHIPLNRALSIVLSRYSFGYAKQKKIDFRQALNIIFKRCFEKLKEKFTKDKIKFSFDYSKFLSMILEENLRLIGFVNSIYTKCWSCYGDNMLYYSNMYYTISFYDIFFYCDTSLIKIILSLFDTEQSKELSFQSLLKMMNIFENETDFINEKEQSTDKDCLLFEKNYEIIIHFLVNENLILETIFSSYEKMINNSSKDILYEIFCEDDLQYIIENMKRRLVPLILSKENYVSHSEIMKLLPTWIKENKKIPIESILDEICDKFQDHNKPIYYRVKEKYYNLSDFFIFKDLMKKKGFLKLMSESCIGPINQVYSRQFYFSEIFENFEFNIIFKLVNVGEINDILSKIVNRFPSLENQYTLPITLINNQLKLIDIIINCLHFKINKILSEHEEYQLMNTSFSTISPSFIYWLNHLKQHKDDNLKEGLIYLTNKIYKKDYRYQFRIKKMKSDSPIISNLHGHVPMVNLVKSISTNTISEESSDLERSFDEKSFYECCKCKNKISPSEYIIYPFCKIAFIANSNFLYHTNIQILKSFYVKNNLSNNKDFPEFKKFVKKLKKEKGQSINYNDSPRVISCGHYIHFECFEATINNKDIDLNDIYFICPECKKISNFIIPFINSNNTTDPLLKSYSFCDYNKSSLNLGENEDEEDEIRINDTFSYISSLFLSKIYKVFTNNSFNINDFLDTFSQKEENDGIQRGNDNHENEEELIVSDHNSNKYNLAETKNFFSFHEYFILIFSNLVRNITFLSIDDLLKSTEIIRIYTNIMKIYLNCGLIQIEFFIKRFEKLLFFFKDPDINKNIIQIIEDDDQTNNLEKNIIELLVLFAIIFKEKEINSFIQTLLKNYFPVIVIKCFIQKEIRDNKYIINHEFILSKISKIEEIKEIDENLLMDFFRSLFIKIIIFTFSYKNYDYKLYYFLKNNFTHSSKEDQNKFIYTCLNITNLTDFYQEIKDTIKDSFDNIQTIYISFLSKNSHLNKPISPDFILSKSSEEKLSLITLPKTILDMCCKYIKIKCKRCNKNPIYSLICLFCGKKLCYLKECCNTCGEGENLYEFQYHTMKCGKGIGCYITIYNGRILFGLNEKFELTKISPYQNKFGEGVKDKDLTHDYVLNEKMYNDLLQKIKNLEFLEYFVTE